MIEIDIQIKERQLMRKLQTDDAVIIYSSKEGACDIIKLEKCKTYQLSGS